MSLFPYCYANTLGDYHYLTQTGWQKGQFMHGSLFPWLPVEKRWLGWSRAKQTEDLGLFCCCLLFYMVSLRAALKGLWAQAAGSLSLGASYLKGSTEVPAACHLAISGPSSLWKVKFCIPSLLLTGEPRLTVLNKLRDTHGGIHERILLISMPISELKYRC